MEPIFLYDLDDGVGIHFEDTFNLKIVDGADSFIVAMVAKSGFLLGTTLCEVKLPCS